MCPYEDLGQLDQNEPASGWRWSNGSNVTLRRARTGLSGLGPRSPRLVSATPKLVFDTLNGVFDTPADVMWKHVAVLCTSTPVLCTLDPDRGLRWHAPLQGYLAHKKQRPPRTPQ